MKRSILTISILAAVVMAVSARFMAVLIDGSAVELHATEFVAADDGSFAISGIPVGQIDRVYNEPELTPELMTPPAAWELPACVLDINSRNGIAEASDDGRYLYSAEYMMEVAGLPFFTTDDLDEALSEASMILISSYLKEHTFSDAEIDRMQRWVADGGILITSAVESGKPSALLDLLGIESVKPKLKTHTTVRWADDAHPELVYFDQPEERETYIGLNYIYTSEYTPSTAVALAHYDDTDIVAATKNVVGRGCAYSIGLRWRDVIQRNQLNKGGKDRSKNNTFEASADMFPLFVRAAYAANSDVAAWRHTIPDGYESVLIPTHDCDSRSALDQMFWLADYEQSLGLRAHYFITTHYFRQPNYMSAFYTEETYPSCLRLIEQGHTVGSHSVCHLPDFNVTGKFPLTVTTPEEYAATCTYDVETKESAGGSTWAEVVMSKQLLEDVLHNRVRSFRSGHLCVNDNIPQALVMGDYSFASCYTATDLRGQFPFRQRMAGSWSGELTPVLQMPLHYSDVRPAGEEINDDNWQDALPVWMDCHLKLKGNYAPNILLIHPNKRCKMEMQRALIDMLDRETVGLCNFEDYGDFWIKRAALDYSYACEDGVLKIVVDADDLGQYRGQGITIDANIPVDQVVVADRAYRIRPVRLIPKSASRMIVVL